MGNKLELNANTNFSREAITKRVAERIETARKNPILESRLAELEQQLGVLKDRFVETGHREPQDVAAEDLIEAEILRSSALAHTLPEFREMLEQIASTYGKSKDWVVDLLAHENAHASVAEQMEHELVGYITIFIKDESGRIVGIQPLTLNKPQLSWGPVKALSAEIEVLDAPREYGNAPSDFDTADIVRAKERLEKIRLREAEDRKRIDELRTDIIRMLKKP